MMNTKYLLVGSEELSREFNDLAGYYSDFHKDVWGFRPRSIALCACDYPDHQSLVEAMSHLKRLVDGVEAAAPAVFEEERKQRERNIAEFEAQVVSNIQYGAKDRADAIAWICDSYGVANEAGQDGWEHLEWQVGVPFGYVQKSLA